MALGQILDQFESTYTQKLLSGTKSVDCQYCCKFSFIVEMTPIFFGVKPRNIAR